MRLWWGKPKPKEERQWTLCILEGDVKMEVPKTSFIKNGMPLLIIEETHMDVLQYGLPTVKTYGYRDPSVSDLRNLPVGVYTIEHYMDLDEFIKEA